MPCCTSLVDMAEPRTDGGTIDEGDARVELAETATGAVAETEVGEAGTESGRLTAGVGAIMGADREIGAKEGAESETEVEVEAGRDSCADAGTVPRASDALR